LKAGEWSTLQVSNAAKTAKILGVSGAGAGILFVCTQTTTVLNLVVFQYTVPLAVAQPWLLPGIALTGAAVVGSTAYRFHKCKKKWKETTKRLNESFEGSM